MSAVSNSRLQGDNLSFGDNDNSSPSTVVMMKAEIVGGNQGKLTLSADSSYGSQVVLDGLTHPSNANEAATKGYVDGIVHTVDDVTLRTNPSNQNKIEIKDGGIGAGKLQSALAGDGLTLGASAFAVDTDNTTMETDSNKLRVKDGGITENKLSASVAGPGLSGGAGQSLALSVDGNSLELNSSGNLQIKAEGVNSGHIGAGAITSVKLASTVETAEFNATTSMSAPSFIATSDRRLKDNIVYTHPVDSLHQVMHMRPASYVFKSTPSELRQGLIAQDLAAVAPHLVATFQHDKQASPRLAVNYSDLSASLIGAVQALQAQLEEVRLLLAELRE